MLPGENVLRAVQRLGRAPGKGGGGGAAGGALRLGRAHKALLRKQAAAAVSAATAAAAPAAEETAAQKAARLKQFNDLTEAADALLNAGLTNAYQETRQSIQARIKERAPAPLVWRPPPRSLCARDLNTPSASQPLPLSRVVQTQRPCPTLPR